jgi:hypothetical protein
LINRTRPISHDTNFSNGLTYLSSLFSLAGYFTSPATQATKH